MFDIGWQEMLIVGVVTLLIVGPKDLPKVIKTVRDGVKQVKGLAREFQSGMDELVREADLDDTKKILKNVQSGSIEKSIRETVDPKGELEQDLSELSEVEAEYKKSISKAGTQTANFTTSSGTTKKAEPEAEKEEAKTEDKPETAPKKKATKKKTTTAKKAPAKKPASKDTKKS